MMQTVTVIVPAYNEGPALAANLATLADAFSIYGESYAFDYLVIDDGSTDETAAVLSSFARYRRNVTVLTHERNHGLGRALRTAFAAATGQFTIVLDADLSYTPSLAIELLERLDAANADVAFASPYMRGGSVVNVPVMRRILSREANRLLSFAAKGRYATFTCMVRAYRTAFLKTLLCSADGMEANVELLLDAIRKRGSLIEMPARLEWSPERRSSMGRANGRALAARTGAIVRLAFSFRPALWLAVPGLFPGLLPLVVGTLLLLHQPATTVALGSLVTIVVQYSSLAYFAGQITAFIAQLFTHARKAPSSRASTV